MYIQLWWKKDGRVLRAICINKQLLNIAISIARQSFKLQG